jgi:hypothetical protein
MASLRNPHGELQSDDQSGSFPFAHFNRANSSRPRFADQAKPAHSAEAAHLSISAD